MTVPSLPEPRHRIFAAVYDRLMGTNDQVLTPLRTFAAGGAVGQVLEIGGGTGHNLLHYSWGAVDSLTLTEPDPFMFRRAQTRLSSLHASTQSKVSLRAAPAEGLPFPDGAFDTAVATLVLCTVRDPTRAIAELYRVLRPGGQLRLIEHVRAEGVTERAQRIVQPVYGWISGDCQLSRDTEALLTRGGFELEVTERSSLGPLWPTFVGVATKPL